MNDQDHAHEFTQGKVAHINESELRHYDESQTMHGLTTLCSAALASAVP